MKLSHVRPSAALGLAVVALVIGLDAPAMAHQVRTVSAKITGSSIKPDTVTGKQVKESTLGVVPKAASAAKATSATTAGNSLKLGGKPASSYAAATASATSGMVRLPIDNTYHQVAQVGPLTWEAECFDGGPDPGLLLQVRASETTFLTLGADNHGGSAQNLKPSVANSPLAVAAVNPSAVGIGYLTPIAVSGASGAGYVGTLYYQAGGTTVPGCLVELTTTS